MKNNNVTVSNTKSCKLSTATTISTTVRQKATTIKSLLIKPLLLGFGVVLLNGCQTQPISTTPATVPMGVPASSTPKPTTTITNPFGSNQTLPAKQPTQSSYPSTSSNPLNTDNIQKPPQSQGSQSTKPNNPLVNSVYKPNVNAPVTAPITAPVTDAVPTPNNYPPITDSPIIVVPKQPTANQDILQRARQNSQNSVNMARHPVNNGDNIPAFRRLMQTGINQIKAGQVQAAEATFTRAQRLAPQSSAVYFYLGQVALKQNQPIKAEATARRGLVVAQTVPRKKALWQVILKAAQLQNDKEIIYEAQKALSAF